MVATIRYQAGLKSDLYAMQHKLLLLLLLSCGKVLKCLYCREFLSTGWDGRMYKLVLEGESAIPGQRISTCVSLHTFVVCIRAQTKFMS